ncbi:MAG: M48 family metallopeptidase [Rhodocyclaceae bacterium]|nr:M48 family metallopeptidase [Rhodocyclaceae bacterium]
MNAFSIIFLAALLLGLALRLYLFVRQIRYVAAHRSAVPDAFQARIELPAHQRAADYTMARVRARLPEAVMGAVWLLWLTLGGLLQDLHGLLGGVFDAGGLAHGVAFLASIAVLGWVFELPFELHRVFVTEARFGFNRVSPTLFVADSLKSAALGAAIGLPLLAGVLWLMGAMGTYWWIYVWGAWLGFNLLAMLIWPTYIAPLFNKFEPLEDETLRERVTRLLSRCGFQSKGLFVMDGSKRSAHGNAYFTGFGSAKRIVFFDTLLNRLDGDEVEAVLAHELGHFRHGHVRKRIAMMSVASFGFLALLGWLAGQPWFFAGLGMQAQDTATLLALFMLAMPVFLLPATPLMSYWSRRHEYEADRYAAANAGARPLVSALVKLYRDNASTLTPDPWYSGFHDSHPPAALRIAHLEQIGTAGPDLTATAAAA